MTKLQKESKTNQSIYILKNFFPHKNTIFLYHITIIILFVNESKKFEVILSKF